MISRKISWEISWSSIWALVLRHARLYRRDANLLLAIFYWPLLDIIIWGFLGSWIAQVQAGQLQNYTTVALLGVLLWQVIGRGCNILCFVFNEELWAQNVVNLFSLPLRLSEWICGAILFSSITMGLTTVIGIATIALLYDVPWWHMLYPFFLFLPPLFLSAIWLGFISLQITITLGKRGTELAYVIIWFLMPFSGAYYPIDILPAWGQKISAVLPMSYVFQAMRGYVMYGQDPVANLRIGYLLSSVYAICALAGFVYCFNRSKRKGLARLVD
jgi:ABC-2 type transport system permease protein